jgi:lipopolysaccharide transport system ATP-binding protein
MSDTVIRVENLGKKYIISHQQQTNSRYVALRDVVADGVRAVGQRLRHPGKPIASPKQEEFWALKDVSFEVKRGEVVGIIGRNGAGKSTLLKILSRITEPTTGRVSLKGRVASLLEVGTGFHPELTGRENIFLNGAILGMSRAEINRKFDEIVEFAEVSRFLDTPVKRYSSGMYVRLAFAVAAHLEPEILVVDEVLAVGDAAFQKKCLGKMQRASQDGRTVLFVSHNMPVIQNLCSHAILFKEGRFSVSGKTDEVINNYLGELSKKTEINSLRDRKDRQGSGRVKIIDFHIEDEGGYTQEILQSGKDYYLIIEYENYDMNYNFSNVVGSIAITDNREEIILLLRSSFTDQNFKLNKIRGKIECQIKDLNLVNGVYNTMLFLSNGEAEILDFIVKATEVIVEGGDYFGTGSIGLPSHCKTLMRADWRIK